MALSEDQRSLEAQLTMWVVNENRKRRSSVPLDELEIKAGQLSGILTPELSDLEVEQVVVVVTTKGNVTQGIDVGIVDRTFRRWIADRKPTTEEKRWLLSRADLVPCDGDENVGGVRAGRGGRGDLVAADADGDVAERAQGPDDLADAVAGGLLQVA